MNMYGGCLDSTQRIVNLGMTQRWPVNYTLFTPEKEPRVTKRQSRRSGDEKNLLPLREM